MTTTIHDYIRLLSDCSHDNNGMHRKIYAWVLGMVRGVASCPGNCSRKVGIYAVGMNANRH